MKLKQLLEEKEDPMVKKDDKHLEAEIRKLVSSFDTLKVEIETLYTNLMEKPGYLLLKPKAAQDLQNLQAKQKEITKRLTKFSDEIKRRMSGREQRN